MTWPNQDDNLDSASLTDLTRYYEAGLAHLEKVPHDDLEARVEHLQALAGTLALGHRLLRIYDAVKFLSPGRRSQLKQWGCVVRGHELKGAERATIIRLELHRHAFTLTFREPEVSYEDVEAYLDLHGDKDALLFSILLQLDVNEPVDGWQPRRVDAFVPGEWVREVLELSLRLDAGGAEGRQDRAPARADELKKRFGLGDE